MDRTNKYYIVKEYLTKFGGLSHSQIARKIYDDYPHIFTDIDKCRYCVRYYCGKAGSLHKKTASNAGSIMEKEGKQNMVLAKRKSRIASRLSMIESYGSATSTSPTTMRLPYPVL